MKFPVSSPSNLKLETSVQAFTALWTEPFPKKLAIASFINNDLPLLLFSMFQCLIQTAGCLYKTCLPTQHSCTPRSFQPSAPALNLSLGSPLAPKSTPVSLDLRISQEMERNILFLIDTSFIIFLLLLLHHMIKNNN